MSNNQNGSFDSPSVPWFSFIGGECFDGKRGMDSSNLKKRRVARACDFCHKRRLKCRPALSTTSSCKTCLEYNVACTQTRELKKRGSSKHQRTYSSYPEPLVHPISIDGHGWALENQGPLSASVLDQLIAVYFDTVYPM